MSQKAKYRGAVQMVFAYDARTGQPRLKTLGKLKLSDSELAPLDDELRTHYEDICSGGRRKSFVFSRAPRGLPRCFNVEVRRSNSAGSPTLLLSSQASGNEANGWSSERGGDWTGGSRDAAFADMGDVGEADVASRTQTSRTTEFADDTPVPGSARLFGRQFERALRDVLQGAAGHDGQRAGVRRLCDELEWMSRERPVDLLLLLAAGYLHVALPMNRDRERDLDYRAASLVIDELCQARMPALQEMEQTPQPRNWLYWLNAARLFGKAQYKHEAQARVSRV